MTSSAKVGSSLLLLLVFLVIWYCIAANYGYWMVSGSYTANFVGGTSSLLLKKDRTFEQSVIMNGREAHAKGTWDRFGEDLITFSGEFIPLPGQAPSLHNIYHAYVRKRWGLFIYISLNEDSREPEYRKYQLGVPR